jgi:hypothetical protein
MQSNDDLADRHASSQVNDSGKRRCEIGEILSLGGLSYRVIYSHQGLYLNSGDPMKAEVVAKVGFVGVERIERNG